MKTTLANILKKTPVLYGVAEMLYSKYRHIRFYFLGSSGNYWEQRYASGENSGAGSYNRLAEYKAKFINSFVKSNGIEYVLEWGCGDGNQLLLAEYKNYVGIDVSPTAIEICHRKFINDSSKRFMLTDEAVNSKVKAELALSLDVIYHLVEDNIYCSYMKNLFLSSNKYIIIYSSNFNDIQREHVRHRDFSDWIKSNQPNWRLVCHEKNTYPYTGDNDTGSLADFFVYSLIG